MRTQHALHTLQHFPIYSAAFVADDVLAVGGGGGSTRSGIKNKIRLYKIAKDTLDLLDEFQLEKDEDAPMSMASDLRGQRLVCGINSSTDQLEKGENNNCRVFTTENNKIQLSTTASTLQVSPETLDDYQKVTAISPDRRFVVAAGSKDVALLTYPSLDRASQTWKTKSEVYDIAFSSAALVVATLNELLVYATPPSTIPMIDGNGATDTISRSKKKRQKGKVSVAQSTVELQSLKTVPVPPIPGVRSGTISFRAVRFHPQHHNVCYTVVNHTPDRIRGSKVTVKRAFVTRWNSDTWEPMRTKEVGKKGVTCFDISANGQWLACGAADLSIGILDAKTLAPLLTILKAHEFPPTVIRFSPKSDVLISGSADNSLRTVALPVNLGSSSVSRTTMLIIGLLVVLSSILTSLYYRGAFL